MNDYREYSSYLLHYGVKGMKWDHHIYADPYVAKGFRSSVRTNEPKRTGFRNVAVSAVQRRNQSRLEEQRRQAQEHQRQLALNSQRQRDNTSSDDGKDSGNTVANTRGDFLSNLQNSLEGQSNNLGNVGEALMEMINNGNYWGAFGYYKSLDMETRHLLDERIKNWELPEALGNGDLKLGRQKVQEGEKIVNTIISAISRDPLYQYNSRVLGKLTGGEIGTGTSTTIRRNEDAKEITGHRKVTHSDEYSDDIYHHGILGMHWGIRRYQNPDGTLTEAGKKRYYKSIVKDVNNYNSASSYYDHNAGAREKLFNNEALKEEAKKLKDVKQKRDDMMNEHGKVYIQNYKDFLGACNVIRNQDNIKNFNIKHYNDGVQKYYKIIDEYSKSQGWESAKDKSKNATLGNTDDLFDILVHKSSDYTESYKKYREAQNNYINEATKLAEEILKNGQLKKPTKRQINTTIFGLSNVKL